MSVVVVTGGAEPLQRAAEVNQLLTSVAKDSPRLELSVIAVGERCLLPAFTVRPTRVLHLQGSCWPVEPLLLLCHQILREHPPALLLAGSDSWSTEVITRLGFRTGGETALRVDSLRIQESGFRYCRPLWDNSFGAEYQTETRPLCLAAAPTTTRPGKPVSYQCETVSLPYVGNPVSIWKKEEQPGLLENARKVLILGNGVRNADDVALLLPLAEKLGLVVGASRPLVMRGLLPMHCQVGVSGAVIAPELTITAGVSGAGALLYGIEKSQKTVAINNDPAAPIFQHADVGIVADLVPFLQQLAVEGLGDVWR